MKILRILTGIGFASIAFGGAAFSAQAAVIDENTCTTAITDALGYEQRMFRAVLFGEPDAGSARVGTVKFDVDGRTWIRIAKDEGSEGKEWASLSGTQEDAVIGDGDAAQMFGLSEQAAQVAPVGTARREKDRTLWVKTDDGWKEGLSLVSTGEFSEEIPGMSGIFATPQVMTSELIPYMLQAMRTFQCKTGVVCEAVRRSFTSDGGSITVQPLGCSETQVPLVEECAFAKSGNTPPEVSRLANYCDAASSALLKREASLLKLAVEYDSAYRTMLQFAGNFDLMLREFRWPLTNTVRQAAGIIAELGRIPCFLGSCDASPPPSSSSESSNTLPRG